MARHSAHDVARRGMRSRRARRTSFSGVSCMVGSPGDGWRILTNALTDERDMLWLMSYAALLRFHRRLQSGLAPQPDLGQQLGRTLADAIAVRAVGMSARAKEARSIPNPEFMALKIMCSESLVRAWDSWATAGGSAAVGDRDLVPDEFEVLTATIYGGTSEVQRDIIGERALGLPRYRGQPFGTSACVHSSRNLPLGHREGIVCGRRLKSGPNDTIFIILRRLSR